MPTHSVKRDAPGRGGRGLGRRCWCGRNATFIERIMGRESGWLCRTHAAEAEAAWEGALKGGVPVAAR